MTSKTSPPVADDCRARTRDLAELRSAAATLRRGLLELEGAIERLEAGQSAGLGASGTPPARRPNWRRREREEEGRQPQRVQLRVRGRDFGMTLYEGSDAFVALEILRKAGTPLHVDELLAAMLEMGHQASRASLVVTLARLAARETVFERVLDAPNTFTLAKGIIVGKPHVAKEDRRRTRRASGTRATPSRRPAVEGEDAAHERALARSGK